MTQEFASAFEYPTEPADPLHPFTFICPQCGADVDAPAPNFTITNAAPIPYTGFMLLELHCDTCELVSDVCMWPVVPKAVTRGDAGGKEGLGDNTLEGIRLLDRYWRLVEESRLEWEALYTKEGYRMAGLYPVDLRRNLLV